MSVLSVCQTAAMRLSMVERPQTVFSTTDRLALELADLANEAALEITQEHEWRGLTKLATITGDGTAIAHNLPSDFKRWPKDVQLYRGGNYCLSKVFDVGEWLEITINQSASIGSWIELDGKLNIYPALAVGETVKFHYLSKNFTASDKDAFQNDSDSFKLDERLLTLGIVWKYRAQKRVDYSEDMKSFQIALEHAIANDGGAKTIRIGSNRQYGELAFPRAIVP